MLKIICFRIVHDTQYFYSPLKILTMNHVINEFAILDNLTMFKWLNLWVFLQLYLLSSSRNLSCCITIFNCFYTLIAFAHLENAFELWIRLKIFIMQVFVARTCLQIYCITIKRNNLKRSFVRPWKKSVLWVEWICI